MDKTTYGIIARIILIPSAFVLFNKFGLPDVFSTTLIGMYVVLSIIDTEPADDMFSFQTANLISVSVLLVNNTYYTHMVIGIAAIVSIFAVIVSSIEKARLKDIRKQCFCDCRYLTPENTSENTSKAFTLKTDEYGIVQLEEYEAD